MCEDVQIPHSLSLKGFLMFSCAEDPARCFVSVYPPSFFSFTFCLSISVWLNQRLAVALPTLSISVLMNLETKAVRCHGLEASASVSSFCTKVKPWYSRHAQREIHLCHVICRFYFLSFFLECPLLDVKGEKLKELCCKVYIHSNMHVFWATLEQCNVAKWSCDFLLLRRWINISSDLSGVDFLNARLVIIWFPS